MYLNDFSVRIPEGHETPGGYVELQHGQQYTLSLRNRRREQCDARVEIDGKKIGVFRLRGNGRVRLERSPVDDGRFTFYRDGTSEAVQVDTGIGITDRGLVKVTFMPERRIEPQQVYRAAGAPKSVWPSPEPRCDTLCAAASSGGITGLSGHSDQQFQTVGALNYDLSQQTVIHLRLVCAGRSDPRPLTAYSTPVPPPV